MINQFSKWISKERKMKVFICRAKLLNVRWPQMVGQKIGINKIVVAAGMRGWVREGETHNL